MTSLIIRQTWALIWRHLIILTRSPIKTFIRMLLWPCLLVGLFTYASLNGAPYLQTQQMIPPLLLFATAFHFYYYVELLVSDRATSFRSLMISMGLRRDSYYLANFVCLTGFNLIIALSVAITAINGSLKDSQSSWLAILAIFVLFTIHLTLVAFVFASFITSTSLVALVIVILMMYFPIHSFFVWLIKSTSLDQSAILFIASLWPYESIMIFIDSYTVCKNCDSSLFQEQNVSQPTYLILIAMTFWSIIAYAFSRWFDRVCPWQSDDLAKEFNFCLKLNSGNKEDNCISDPDELSEYFEKCSRQRQIGIKICNLTKEYKNVPVVDNVSFDIYSGETTLLLGHNGAGKTTLMNLILGKLNPSKGTVSIKALSGSAHSPNISSSIGVCPQTSVLDDKLNVEQHLKLFADIKWTAASSEERYRHIRATIDDVSLSDNIFKLPGELSGGMKRKLSLGLAFVGNSNVLILDEPSSGLDPDSRVFIWNAIRRYRTERTVLLSTQHMEEADYLGDRIAIMKEGRMICCGSSTFLTKVFGTGYKLRIECFASRKEQVMTLIKRYFKKAKASEYDSNETASSSEQGPPVLDMVVELTESGSDDTEADLINLLQDIENNKEAHGVKSYGLKCSSIEDVMLSTGKSSERTLRVGDGDSPHVSVDQQDSELRSFIGSEKITGASFASIQMRLLHAFATKHVHTYRRDWKTILLYRLIIPTFGLYNFIPTIESNTFSANPFNAILIFHLIHYPALEKVSKFKIMQLTSDANFIIYWMSQLLVDLLSITYLVLSFSILLLSGVGIDIVFLAPMFEVYMILMLAIFLFGLSAALLAYILSTMIKDSKTATGYFFLLFLPGTIISMMLTITRVIIEKDITWLKTVFEQLFILLLPTDALQYIVYGLRSKCYVHAGATSICQPKGGFSPVLEGFIVLFGQIIVYTSTLFLIERNMIDLSNYFGSFFAIFRRSKSSLLQSHRAIDEDVIEEAKKAEHLLSESPTDLYSLIVSNLSKSYIKGLKVIDRLSFTVARGECFGLLGINGAGKSTTFSTIAGETKPDAGKVWLRGRYLSDSDLAYRRQLGFDPQSSPEILLSPVEALYLMARLRLAEEPNIRRMVMYLLDVLDMSEHGSKASSELSGGTRRKLALAMSLIGNPPQLALDEPTAGVDPLARRGVWHLLRSLRKQGGASIVVASHAMEECEAICDRISIMARGCLRCVGTFLHLRSKFAKGCTIRIQFTGEDKDSTPKIVKDSMIAELESSLRMDAGPSVKLMDRNINSAAFEVSDRSVRHSTLFIILRSFKQKYSNISYSINDSSLEDIFISLAREEHEQTTFVQTSSRV